jgi:hypothetical protein
MIYPPCLTSSSIESKSCQLAPYAQNNECADFVLVHNPALELLVVAIMTAALLDNVVDGKVFQACVLREGLTVGRLANSWRTSDDYVWLCPHRVL